jgi:hypothetical protein
VNVTKKQRKAEFTAERSRRDVISSMSCTAMAGCSINKRSSNIVFGSAVHVPSRVQIKIPARESWSATAAPFADWSKTQEFSLTGILAAWGVGEKKQEGAPAVAEKPPKGR